MLSSLLREVRGPALHRPDRRLAGSVVARLPDGGAQVKDPVHLEDASEVRRPKGGSVVALEYQGAPVLSEVGFDVPSGGDPCGIVDRRPFDLLMAGEVPDAQSRPSSIHPTRSGVIRRPHRTGEEPLESRLPPA
jgi:hypothetical protein